MPYVVFAVIESKKKTKNFGHFAECNTRQRAFAERLLPCHSAKLPKKCATRSLCRVPVPRHSAKLCTLTCVSQLCRVPGLWHSAKNFPIFFSLPSVVSARHSAKDFSKKKYFFFAECRVRKALGKGFFKKKERKSFAECLPDPALGKDVVNG